MPQYRKKPVIVEAFRLPEEGDYMVEGFIEWAQANDFHNYLSDRDEGLLIETLEGSMRADPGDWIIKGVAGEFYPCKHEIFKETYEPVVPAAPVGETSGPSPVKYPFGMCPICGAAGKTRERRPHGNDTCEAGHLYPSRNARVPWHPIPKCLHPHTTVNFKDNITRCLSCGEELVPDRSGLRVTVLEEDRHCDND